MKHIKIIILFLGVACMWACSKDLPDAGTTPTVKVANEWWVADNGARERKISTFNTSSLTPDSIWVACIIKPIPPAIPVPDTFQVKVKLDVTNFTFSAQNAKNVTGTLINSVNISNGKIFPNGGKSLTGNITDSIYLEAEYSNAPGVKHVLAGVARTRWDVDDY